MCDAGDIVDIGAGVLTGGATYAYKKATGDDLPTVALAKSVVGAGPKLATPTAPEPTPPTPDLSDELVQRAAIARRLRQMTMQGIGSTFLTGPNGLLTPAPVSTPGLGGV